MIPIKCNFKIFEQNGSWEDIYKHLIQKKLKITVLCNINLYSYQKTFFIEFLKVLSIKVTCLYFGKPEVNRADLSCIFSLREK